MSPLPTKPLASFADELLRKEMFARLSEAKVLIEKNSNHYKYEHPRSVLGYQAPAELESLCEWAGVDE